MKLRKRVLSVGLAFVLLLSLLPAAAFAEDVTYTETVTFTTDATEGDVAFLAAYTSDANTEIIFASTSSIYSQMLDAGDGTVPAGRTKYIHTDESIDDIRGVSGNYTYYLNNNDSAVILERLNMTLATFNVANGALTIGDSGKVAYVYVDGEKAVLNLLDGSKISTRLYYTEGTVNLSGAVTINKMTFNADAEPMTVTSSIAGSSISIYGWEGDTSNGIVLAQGTEDYELTEDDLAAFDISSTQTISGYSLVLYHNQILYTDHVGDDYTVTLAGLDENNSITADYSNCNSSIYNTLGAYLNEVTGGGSLLYFEGALVEPTVTVTDSSGNTLTEAARDENGDYVVDDNGDYISGDFIVTYTTATDHALLGSSETATATVTGIRDYTGEFTKAISYTVNRTSASTLTVDEEVTLIAAEVGSVTPGYDLGSDGTGKAALEAALEVCDGGTELEPGVHYNVSVGTSTVTSAGEYTIYVRGIGPYYGTTTTTLNLEQVDLGTSEQITLADISDYYYTGSAITPNPSLTYTRADGTPAPLVKGTDFTVEYADNTEIGTATVTITGIGNYTGTLTTTFDIISSSTAENVLPVSNEAELTAALGYGLTDITIDADFTLTSPVELTYGVTISGYEGEIHTITSAMTGGTMFTAAEGVSVTLNDVTLNGSGTSALLYVCADANVNIGADVVLENGYYTSSSGGAAALYIETGAEVTLAGTVQDCTGGSGCPIYNLGTLNIVDGAYLTGLASSTNAIRNAGTLNMTGGTIAPAVANCFGNMTTGAFLWNTGTFNLSGGTITGFYEDGETVRTTVYFGGVYNNSTGTFNMTGGTIEGFEAAGDASANSYGPSGAGVYNVGTFNLSGGLITENVCTGSTTTTASGQGNNYTSSSSGSGMGGGVYNAGVFAMSGGTISNNSAQLGGGVYNAGARNLTNSYSEDAGTFTMTGGTITGNCVFSETVYNASSGSGSGMMGGKGTLVAGVGSALYVGGGSTTVLSGGTIDTDQVNTVETTDSNGNAVEETVSVGIAVVPTINSSGNATGSSFTATVATNSNLTIQDGADIQVGIVLVSTSTVYLSAVLDTGTYTETGETVWSGAYETGRTSDTNGLAYLLLDGSMGDNIELDVTALSVDSTTYSFSNIPATGTSYPTSYTASQISLNYDGALVAVYDDGIATDDADADHFTLTANGADVNTADAALYLSTYAISDDTTADAWVICIHSAELEYVEATAATCTEDGVLAHYVCPTCGTLFDEDGTTVVTEEELVGESATGHDYQFTYTWSADRSACTVTITCSQGDYEAVTEDCTVTQAMDENGATVYTASWTFQGATYSDIVTHTHTYVGTAETTPATCTEDGYITVTVACADGDSQLYTYTIPVSATGHSWDEGVETVAATRYTQGEVVYTCSVCGETKTEYTNKVNATFLFDDVMNDSQYYFIPVYWAYDLGITDGTSATTFSPSQGCTRAQFVTFLYRLAQATGEDTSIETTSTAFTDVDSDDYFYEAVLWAAKNGITDGTSATTFTPNRTITRREAITMLYRYECAVNETPTVETENPFSDVTTSDYAYTAILWANETNVTSGTSETTFSPANTCTRAMMVTFLYNYAAILD